jgi:hypothetical protein
MKTVSAYQSSSNAMLGAVIVGSVDGNRLWGKDIKGYVLTNVQWAPNGKNILFGTGRGDLLFYDLNGNFGVCGEKDRANRSLKYRIIALRKAMPSRLQEWSGITG